MIPGEIQVAAGDILLNEGRVTLSLSVENTGDRPVQVGSHYHFAETNPALKFDRPRARFSPQYCLGHRGALRTGAVPGGGVGGLCR